MGRLSLQNKIKKSSLIMFGSFYLKGKKEKRKENVNFSREF